MILIQPRPLRLAAWAVGFLGIVGLCRAAEPQLPIGVGVFPQELRTFYSLDEGLPRLQHAKSSSAQRQPPSGQITATATGLLIDGVPQYPHAGNLRWAPTNVQVAVDGLDRLWFCSDQGVGCLEGQTWKLHTTANGLPVDGFTCIAAAADGTVWLGTRQGALRFDGRSWAYRQGKRWLPHDEVRDIAVDQDGSAWIATPAGVAHLHFQPMTLAEKAEFYEREIDQHHRRTEFGFVIEAHAPEPGSKTDLRLHDSDNDGLWTSMYGAGECFAYGATKSEAARRRAQDAFRALKFLSDVPQGSPHEPPHGFIARTVLEAAGGRDPNAGGYTLEAQRQTRQRDKLWRVYEPRWPLSADGRYYWKSDTSSDELDGHYFFYAAYFDLVAESEAEKNAVRDVVRANIDHLIAHDFSLHDHAGRTRWAVYSPGELNQNPQWFIERGLNSLSMLSYLNVAHHLTGDPKYREVARKLRDEHSYHLNALVPKIQSGLGSGNQSDDEMAFMAFYNLIRYEPDQTLRKLYLTAFAKYWQLEAPEMNPFFNYCYAAVALREEVADNWGRYSVSPPADCFDDAVDTLKRFPLDRFNWHHQNSHRKDLRMLRDHNAESYFGDAEGRGYRVNGKVLPVDERHFNHWNHDPWKLDTGGGGDTLSDGAVFTLPYYMGLYHGLLAVD